MTDVFAQVLQGRTADVPRLRDAVRGWLDEPSPMLGGWVGTTAGVADDGRFVAVVRWRTEPPSPRDRASVRPSPAWSTVCAALDGRVTVRTGRVVDAAFAGSPGGAGFVQVVQGAVVDMDAALDHLLALQDAFGRHLRALVGTVTVDHGDHRFTRVLHYSSEEAARAAERDPAPELLERDHQAVRLLDGALDFLDLHDPVVRVAAARAPAARVPVTG